MEIRDRGMIKQKIALALYNTFLSSLVILNNGTCKPQDFKKYLQGHLDTDGELGKEDIQIFFDLFAPDAQGAYELRFDIYVKSNVISDTRLSSFAGNVLDNVLIIINDCLEVENIENNLFGCIVAPNPVIEPNNKFDYCGVTVRYAVRDR